MWGNSLLFMLVQSTQRFTYVWLVLELGRGADASGLVLFALGLPVFLFVLPAGALSDRVDRRRLLMASQVGALVVTVATTALVAAGWLGVGGAAGLAFLLGCSLAAGQPVRQAVVPAIVPRDALLQAISVMVLGQNLAMVVGPAVGGAAIDAWGIAGAFGLQATLYVIGLALLVPLRLPPLPPAEGARKSMRAQIGEGLRFVAGDRGLRALFVLLSGSGLLMLGPYLALIPAIARDELGADAFETSLLLAALGVGMGATSLILAARRTLSRRGVWFAGALVCGGTIQIGLGLSRWYAVTVVLMLAWGLSGGLFVNLNQALIQTQTPDRVMGRVMSMHALAMAGLSPAGALATGALAAAIGAPVTVALCGAAMAVLAAVVLSTQPGLRALT